jgi:hypothetical protein
MSSALTVPVASTLDRLPVLFQTIPEGGRRFWEFLTINIPNPNTLRAHFKAVEGFAAWCDKSGYRLRCGQCLWRREPATRCT